MEGQAVVLDSAPSSGAPAGPTKAGAFAPPGLLGASRALRAVLAACIFTPADVAGDLDALRRCAPSRRQG